MPRITVTFDDAAHKWVSDQAEERGCPKSDVVRELVDEARGEGRSLEARVAALEEQVFRGDPGGSGPHQGGVGRDTTAHQGGAGIEMQVRDAIESGEG